MLILDFMDDLFHGSWCSTISRIQGMFRDTRQPNIVFLWALLLVWDARKCKCIIHVPPLIEKVVLLILMLVPAIQACEQSWF
jgi:hypothetical protein